MPYCTAENLGLLHNNWHRVRTIAAQNAGIVPKNAAAADRCGPGAFTRTVSDDVGVMHVDMRLRLRQAAPP